MPSTNSCNRAPTVGRGGKRNAHKMLFSLPAIRVARIIETNNFYASICSHATLMELYLNISWRAVRQRDSKVSASVVRRPSLCPSAADDAHSLSDRIVEYRERTSSTCYWCPPPSPHELIKGGRVRCFFICK